MKEKEFYNQVKKVYHILLVLFFLFVIIGFGLIYNIINPNNLVFNTKSRSIVITQVEENLDRIENGIHIRTGFKDAEGLMIVVNNCTNCHSAKLVIQNRMNRERWNTTIKWMQDTQNLWDLGKNQEIIVNYLVANYPPKHIGRRKELTEIEWYELK